MDRDELKVRINNRIVSHLLHGVMIPGVEDAIIDIIAPILADAEKWRRVKEIAKYGHKTCSRECPAWDFCCDGLCQNVFEVVDALEGKVKG